MKKRALKWIISATVGLMLTPQAYGSTQLSSALEDAKNRSDSDQSHIQRKMMEEQVSRQEDWSQRDSEAITISHIPQSSYILDIDADLETSESGEDNSGLNRLRSNVEEESTDIDFDEELREVSMTD